MNYQQIDPDLPGLQRWLRLNKNFPGQSTLRMLEYEALAKVDLSGKILDLGGGEKSAYRSGLPAKLDYSSVNIDPEIEPTWLVRPGEKLPIENNVFDACLSMNTLEHVYDPKLLVEEIFRTLKPGGSVYISVPWIFRIHGHPDDFTRATPSWWRITLENAGFSSATILPLIWGRYSTAASITGYKGPLRKIRTHITHLNDLLYSILAFRGTNGKYIGRRGQSICNVAPGHFITAVK